MATRNIPQKVEVVEEPDPVYGRNYELRISTTPAMVQTIRLTFDEIVELYNLLGPIVD